MLNDIIKESGKPVGRLSGWRILFRIAAAVTYFQDLADQAFRRKKRNHLLDFAGKFFRIDPHQANWKQYSRLTHLAPYWLRLEIDSQNDSVLHNMIDWDLYSHTSRDDLWSLPEKNHDWVQWEDDKLELSKVFLNYYQDHNPV